ncbi:TVP38/TMEM64 family protein [Natronoarchaeum rubrum]|uniref:TVP38/TMEM64 family protein n=1 Tax=Natronoarchaeum rubrum TaxID=755311 RepID=UPI00211381A6|nr:VTT domain-containing protein [Natronoarchaeum rubrum]
MESGTRRSLAGVGLLAVVAAVALTLSPDTAIGAIDTAADDPAMFLAVVAALYFVRPLALWPPTLVAIVVGYGLGIAAGVPVALAGAALTSMPTYAAARWVGAGNDCAPIERLASVGGGYFGSAGDLRGVVAARLAPIPADAVSCAAGLSAVPPRAFALGVLVGELPWTVAAVVVGNSLSTITARGLGGVGLPLAVATTAAAVLLLAGPAYERFGNRSTGA